LRGAAEAERAVTMKIDHLIQSNWNNGLSPRVDGVVFADGTVWSVEYYEVRHKGIWGNFANFRGANPSRLQSDISWVEIDEHCYVLDADDGVRYSCGDGALGGDGYVACSQTSDNHLNWIAFFQDSNPFLKISLVSERVNAVNNHTHVWSFNVNNPIDLIIS
jgi:hypothetical protein